MKNFNNRIIFFALLFAISFTRESSSQMFWNQAASFSGLSTSFIARGNSATLNITGSFTLEAWISPTNATAPSFQILFQKRETASVGYTLYLNGGRVTIRTNGTTRLVGKTVLSNNNWSHVAGTYNSATGLFSVYVNGVLDTSTTIAGAAPLTNTDSLLIGRGSNSPFAGLMDEIRIWNRNLSTSEINTYRRTSLGTASGIYNGLVFSLTFQDNEVSTSAFSLDDWSGNFNSVINKGATVVDLSNRPLQTINMNDCLEFDGNNDYAACEDNVTITPTDELTIETWIYPRSVDKNNVIIHKGSPDGASIDYSVGLYNGSLQAVINSNISLTSNDIIPLNRWTHIAFTFDGLNGFNKFYINGEESDVGINDKGIIVDGTDSLYIGGTIDLTDFDGFIDEVKITRGVKTLAEINEYMFKSTEASNDLPFTESVYNLDGYAVANAGPFNRLYFRNTCAFSHSGTVNNKPVSPMNRCDKVNFSESFYISNPDLRVPSSGTSGIVVDTLNVSLNQTITDVNVFVAMNHTAEQNLVITVIAPNGETVTLINSTTLVTDADNMITIFDDDADSSLVSSRYVSFSPKIKPSSNLNAMFSGDNSFGAWKLLVNDNAASDTGRLYAWGIQFNNAASKPSILLSGAIIQGFYNPSTNLMVRDTMRIKLRRPSSPFDVVDSSLAYLGNNGGGSFTFNNVEAGDLYYIELKHRNSIQTWSSEFISFDPLTSQASYNFIPEVTAAFGDNMIQVDNTPVRFAIYGGDVSQDLTVDLSDITQVFNDANLFLAGYVVTDVTGDNFVDLSDITLTFNNAEAFVSAILPEVLDQNLLNEKEVYDPSLMIEQKFDAVNQKLIVRVNLQSEADAKLFIEDVSGNEVALIANERMPDGIREFEFDCSSLSKSGYLLKLKTGGRFKTVRMKLQ